MRKLLVLTVALAMTAGVGAWCVEAQETFRVNQEILGRLEFPVPNDEAGKKYLGLSEVDKFTLSQIKAETVILEIFSMYCPICQAEAPTVNELHRMIERDARLKGKVKIVGVGTGNTPFEVDVFRKKYDVPFPLFADEKFLIQKTSEDKIRTPTFLTLKIGLGTEPVVQGVHIGRLESPQKFLETLPGVSRRK
ncbi:MAG: TlpA disulfide reductase family protein [Desulfomonilaceae bacterium]|nr:TlpA disulfide reductase family protein [Desulfomonilaceae bacterium]